MKRTIYKVCLLSAMIFLIGFVASFNASADGGEKELTVGADGYQATLVFEKPVAIGENQIQLRISDGDGQPVTNALVEAAVITVEAEHAQEGHNETEASHTEGPASPDNMHGMEGMPGETANHIPVNEHLEMVAFTAGHEAGEYKGVIDVTGHGEWTVRVHIALEDNHLIKLDFPFHLAEAQTSGRNILLGFLSINAAILGTAFTLKLKSKPVSV